MVAELREQCRKLGIELPQPDPVVASSIFKARMKVDESLLLDPRREILRSRDGGRRWKGRRIHAVDGSKVNLPRPLADAGYAVPEGAHYPQGLVSCLYRRDAKTTVDFLLSADANERAAALRHFDALEPGDVVAFDRRCFSCEPPATWPSAASTRRTGPARHRPGLRRIRGRRLRRRDPGRGTGPGQAPRAAQRSAGAGVRADRGSPCRLRGQGRILLLRRHFPGRRSIEELRKVSRQFISVDDFHAPGERGAEQELCAHFSLVAATRLFANGGDGLPGR